MALFQHPMILTDITLAYSIRTLLSFFADYFCSNVRDSKLLLLIPTSVYISCLMINKQVNKMYILKKCSEKIHSIYLFTRKAKFTFQVKKKLTPAFSRRLSRFIRPFVSRNSFLAISSSFIWRCWLLRLWQTWFTEFQVPCDKLTENISAQGQVRDTTWQISYYVAREHHIHIQKNACYSGLKITVVNFSHLWEGGNFSLVAKTFASFLRIWKKAWNGWNHHQIITSK